MNPVHPLVSQLIIQFGKGDNPLIRYRLYSRLARMVDGPCGDVVRCVIGEVIMAAKTKDKPGNWFAKTVVIRLVDLGLMTRDEETDRRNAANRATVAGVINSVANGFSGPGG